MGSDSVRGLSFGTIVFLGIWEAAKIMSHSLKLATSADFAQTVKRLAHNASSQMPRTTMNPQIHPRTLSLPMLTIGYITYLPYNSKESTTPDFAE